MGTIATAEDIIRYIRRISVVSKVDTSAVMLALGFPDTVEERAAWAATTSTQVGGIGASAGGGGSFKKARCPICALTSHAVDQCAWTKKGITPTCHGCGKTGHIRPACLTVKATTKCATCGKGHLTAVHDQVTPLLASGTRASSHFAVHVYERMISFWNKDL
jgi:hypothetical protein